MIITPAENFNFPSELLYNPTRRFSFRRRAVRRRKTTGGSFFAIDRSAAVLLGGTISVAFRRDLAEGDFIPSSNCPTKGRC